MRHLIFSIVGSPPESPSVNPPGAGTIGFETEYQVGHNAPPDILIGMPASLLLLACSPRPGVARQHERFPENDSPWLHLKSEPAERPIQRLRPVVHERRQWERRELRPVFGITERPSPTLAVAVHEIIPLDGAAMGTDAGQVLASHRLRILRTHAPIHVEQASERLGQQSGLVHPAPGDDTATVSVPSCEFQEQAGCMVLYPHFQQGTGLTLRIKATLLSVHTSGALSVLVTSHAIDSPAYTGRISMPMIRSPSSMDLSRTILSPPYHSPAQRRFGISGAE